MKIITKLYLTVSAIAIIFMSKYCLCYSDVTVQALAKSINKNTRIYANKVQFHKNVYGIEDGILSSTAIEDTTLTMGALYYQYRPVISSNIYLNNVNISFPINISDLGDDFSISNSVSYAENLIISDLLYKNRTAAKISQDKDGNIYKISCDDFNLKIDTVGVGTTLSQVIARWGDPDLSRNGQLNFYILDDGITISFINDGNGNITNISCGVTEEINKERYGL